MNKDDVDELDKALNPKTYMDIPEGCIKASENFTERDWEICKLANEKIARRLSYGIREELVDDDGIRLSWSNGAKAWFSSGNKIKKGEVVSMDANEMFLPISPARLGRINECLGTLPLYFGSFEAQESGEVLRADALELWAKGQVDRMKREKMK